MANSNVGPRRRSKKPEDYKGVIQHHPDSTKLHQMTGVRRNRYTVEEKIEIAKKICALFSTGKYKMAHCCKRYGINHSLFVRWAAPSVRLDELVMQGKPMPTGAIPAVQDIYFEARKLSMGNSRDAMLHLAYRKLQEKIEGEPYREVVTDYDVDRELYIEDEHGNKVVNTNFGKPIRTKIKVKEGNRASDTELIKEVLYNLDPTSFKNRKIVSTEGTVTVEHVNLEKLTADELRAKKLEIRRKLEEKNIDIEAIEFTDIPL